MTTPVLKTGDNQRGFGLDKGYAEASQSLFPNLGLVTEAD
jgi:hypothetical protein